MRWLTFNCIMLACIATTLATKETRPKRDLQFWKDLITAKLGLTPHKPVIHQDVKIFTIPGFEKVLVRAVPKAMVDAPVPERIVDVDPTLLAIQSYLGTKTPDETVVALQGVKNLLQSGVLTARQDSIELPPPSPPVYILPSLVQQKADCPEPRPLQVIQKTVVPMPAPTFPIPTPEFPTVPRPIPVLPPPAPVFPVVRVAPKIILPQIRTLPPPPPLVSIPVVPTKYSYKQTNIDGSVTSYISLGNQEIIVTETGKPLPPPPSYIIDRFQKIIFGMPLGVKMTSVLAPSPASIFVAPRPVLDNVLPPPIISEPILPIMTKPADVDITVEHPNKVLHEGTINIYEGTKITKSKPDVEVDIDSAKSKSSEASMQFEHISKLPSPPPEFLQRFEKVVGKRPNSRYSMKTSNGEGTYETFDGSKIYYSHLLPGEKALPDPLSSQSGDKNKVSKGNVYVVGEDTKTDEFGKPFLSYKSKEGHSSMTVNSEIQPIKKMPPLPLPIAGENEYSKIPIVVNFEKNHDENSGFSYAQVIHDGTVKKITGDGNVTGPEIVVEALKPKLPHVIIEERPPLPPAPVIVKVENPGFSYTQINSAGVTKITEDTQSHHDVEPVRMPIRPAVILKPIAPAPSVFAVEDCLKGFSYTQLRGGEVTVIKENRRKPVLVQKIAGVPVVHTAPTIIDVIRPAPPPVFVGFGVRSPHIVHKVHTVPVLPPAPAIIDVIKPAPGPVLVKTPKIVHKVVRVPIIPPRPPPEFVDVKPAGPVAVKVRKNNGPVMFVEPVVSSYTYKQISHTNPRPFTIVPVGNQPVIEVPKAEVRVKVNRHHHRKPDGTVYPCTEVHMVPTADPVVAVEIPVAPTSSLRTAEVVSTVPKDFLYIPPAVVDATPLRSQKIEVTKQGSHFSYTQVSSATSTVPSTSEGTTFATSTVRSTSEGTTSAASESTPLSLSLNPIVVAPEGSNFSYTQTHSDDSSVNIQGNKEHVHVNVNNSQDNVLNRGDIPDA